MRKISLYFLLLLASCQINEIHIDKDDPLKSVPVEDFGANGTDLIDDSEAFNAALANHGRVTIDTGKYVIDNTVRLDNYNKLTGDGMPDRYARDVKGTAIIAGPTVKEIFHINGYGNELTNMMVTGNFNQSPYGDSLEIIINTGSGIGNSLFENLIFRDIPTEYICMKFSHTSNSNIINRCYFYGGAWGIYFKKPQYFTTIENCRFWQLDNGIFIGRGFTSFYLRNCTFETIVGPAIDLDSFVWFNLKFENIHVEWAWPFIKTGTSARPIIEIDGLYGWGDENVYLIDLNCDAKIVIRNVVLYGLSGWQEGQDFPIKNYDTYKDNIKFENVKIMKYQSSNQYKYWNKEFNE